MRVRGGIIATTAAMIGAITCADVLLVADILDLLAMGPPIL